jgi:hypothetical protein
MKIIYHKTIDEDYSSQTQQPAYSNNSILATFNPFEAFGSYPFGNGYKRISTNNKSQY